MVSIPGWVAAAEVVTARRLLRGVRPGSGPRVRAAFLMPRSAKPAWRSTRALGEKVFYQGWQYMRGLLEAVQCSTLDEPQSADAPGEANPGTSGAPRRLTPAEARRWRRSVLRRAPATATAACAAAAAPQGYSPLELRELLLRGPQR